MANQKIGLRAIRALKPGETIWDVTPGFGARRQKGEAVAYILFYRTKEGRQRWQTIGRHGAPWTPETAREEAKRLLGDVARGKDPATEKTSTRKAATVTELCDMYLKDALSGRLLTHRKIPKKLSTLETDKGRIERHIKPLIGRQKVNSITRQDIDNFMHDVAEGKTAGEFKSDKKYGLAIVRGGKGTASRTLGLLGAIFTYAVNHRMRHDNPARGVIRFAYGKRERRLTETEYNLLGKGLAKAEAKQIWPAAVAAARFLVVTGWRRSEPLKLRWKEIDLVRRTATLSDSKTGRSVRPLSKAACDILITMPRGSDNSLVFPPSRGDKIMGGFPKFWSKIRELSSDDTTKKQTTEKRHPDAHLPKDVTPHVMRHSFISQAADMGYSESTIAAMVGHTGHSVTSRYIHTADAVLLAATDAVANKILELMGVSQKKADILPFKQPKL